MITLPCHVEATIWSFVVFEEYRRHLFSSYLRGPCPSIAGHLHTRSVTTSEKINVVLSPYRIVLRSECVLGKKEKKKGNNKVQTFIDKGGCRKFAWKSLVGRVTPETGIVNNYEWLKRLWISRMLKYYYLLTSCSEINRRTGAKRRSNWRPLQCSVASQCSACHFPILPLPLACLVNCAVWYYGILLWGSYFYEACCFLLWSRF